MKTRTICKQLLESASAGILLLLLIQASLAAGQEKNATSPQKETGKYAGVETCKTCDEDLYKNNFENTPHFKTTLQDYYQYGEGSFVGPTNPRYFHANNATFSLRWAF